MPAAIEASGLTKVFGETAAVDGLDLRVEQGQVFGFLGPNGAGKTTTIRVLLDLYHPSAGSVSVLGLDSVRDSVAIHARCGYLPGDLELYPRMTGQRVLDWFARARGGDDTAFRSELVERFDVTLDRHVHELSKGNRQKIGLVLAFMHRPELLVLVEVQRVADRVAIIKDGQLVVTGSVEALRRQAPQTIELHFRAPVAAGAFEGLDGVQRVTVDGNRVSLQAAGELAPLLRVIADHDPVELVTRHADLDELFLTYYRDTPSTDAD
jgi:ABC-2 type transport system ATP-binding protein